MPEQFFRKIIQVTAEHSPNVRLARMQIAAGIEPTDEQIFPGVLSWGEFRKREATWDLPRKTVGLYAEFYKGPDVLLFPPHWLNHAHDLYDDLRRFKTRRIPRAMGVDPAEGGDHTSFAIVDEFGLIHLHTEKTPNTSEIFRKAVGFINIYRIPPENVLFDRGGGGKQIADQLNTAGYPVRSMGFSEKPASAVTLQAKTLKKQIDDQGERYIYKNRRAELYWSLSYKMDPDGPGGGFAISSREEELRRQLAPFPKKWDNEGVVWLPPKDRKPGTKKGVPTLKEILGRSPDDADATVLGLFALTHKGHRSVVGMAT